MHQHRLLVVDDDPQTRSAFSELFRRMGWKVSVASGVAEALERLETEPEPCCLVLDLDLADGHGETVLEHVREKGLRSHVAVCSGSMDQPRLERISDLKPDALLTKPVTINDVWTGVCRLTETE